MASFLRHSWNRPFNDWLSEHRPDGLDGPTARAWLEQGRALLILDGVDEVPRSHGEGAAAWHPRALLLSGLTAALLVWCSAGNRVLVTSRPYGLEEAELRRLGLEQARLAPLTDERQGLFAPPLVHRPGGHQDG